MPMDATAMQSGDQGLPQAASQSSASARLQQIDPRLVSAVIESLSAQISNRFIISSTENWITSLTTRYL